MQKRNDDIVYLTLIDFLIQLIFFSLFVFVIYKNSNVPTYMPPTWVNDKTYAPILEGYGPFIRAENVKKFQEIWKYLKSQKDLDDLVSSLKTAASVAELKKGAEVVSKGGGADKVEKKIIGKKSCLEDGSTNSVLAFEAYDEFIKVTDITAIGLEEISKRGIIVKVGDVIPKSQIGSKFSRFFEPNCIFFVDYIRHTDSEKMRYEVERNFLIRRK